MDIFGGRPMLQAGALAAVAAVCGFYFNITGKFLLALLFLLFIVVCTVFVVLKKINLYRFFSNLIIVLIGCGVLFSSYLYYDVGYLGALRFTGEGRRVLCEISDIQMAGSFYTDYKVKILEIDGEKCDIDALLECEYASDLQRGDVAALTNISITNSLDSVYSNSHPLADGVFLNLVSDNSENCVRCDIGEADFLDLLSLTNMQLSFKLMRNVKGEAGALASAMILGNRAGITPSVYKSFSRSGVSHLLAISGLHLSLIASILGLLLTIMGIGKGIRSCLLLGFIVFYLFLIDFPISAVRAAIMLGITYISYLFGMSDDGMSSLGLAAWVILLFSPAAILDIGFVLSFGAALSILILIPITKEKFRDILKKDHLKMRIALESDPSRRSELNKKRKRFVFFVSVLEKVVSAVVVAFAVWLLTLVPVWYSIGNMSLASVFSNLLIGPAAWLFIFLSLLSLVLGGIPIIGTFINVGALTAGDFILNITDEISSIEHIVISLRHDFVGPAAVISLVLTVILISVKLKRRWLAVLPSYLGLAIVIVGVLISNHTADSVVADFMSSGNNDAVIMTKGDGAVICDITGGSSWLLNKGAKRAADHGATEVEALVLTHYHERHVGSVGAFIESNSVRRLWMPEPQNVKEAAIMSRLADIAEKNGITCAMYQSGEALVVFSDCKLSFIGEKAPQGYSHSAVSILFTREDQSFMYLGSLGLDSQGADKHADKQLTALAIGSHGSGAKDDERRFFPPAQKIYFSERAMLERAIPCVDMRSYESIFVDCKIASTVFY